MAQTSAVATEPVTIEALVRMIGNVGVPAVLLFYLLSQLTPRLDAIAANVAASNTQLAIIGASCSTTRPPLSNAAPLLFDPVLLGYGTDVGHSP